MSRYYAILMSTYAYPVRNAKGEAVISTGGKAVRSLFSMEVAARSRVEVTSTGEAEFEERPFWGRFLFLSMRKDVFFLNSAPLINNLKMD